jgi:hypothetical protein
MLNQKKVEIFSRKFRKSLAKQFLEVAYRLLLIIACPENVFVDFFVQLFSKELKNTSKLEKEM